MASLKNDNKRLQHLITEKGIDASDATPTQSPDPQLSLDDPTSLGAPCSV